ncbi:MAG: OsmC family protein [Conexivisphaerales archaeon]
MSESGPEVVLTRTEGYRFAVQFDDEAKTMIYMDEPPPLSKGNGPNASRLLAASVANCLSASLLFCLTKVHVEVIGITARARPVSARNEQGYWRVKEIFVDIHVKLKGEDAGINRCLSIFENYCVVTGSVRKGIDVHVNVSTEKVS